jgi:predicted MFS family arabinose efflux permease
MALASGLRASGGLFVSPLNGVSGSGLAALSLVFASAQLVQGLVQPTLGAAADRYGAARVAALGAPAVALATAWPAWWHSQAAVTGSVLIAAAAVCAIGSNGILLGEVGRRVDARGAGFAAAIVGSGGSFGQMLVGPATQALLDSVGWQQALVALGLASLAAWPLARLLGRGPQPVAGAVSVPLADALRSGHFWRVAGSLGICGFHFGFLTVHMPGVIERCGLGLALAGPWLALAGAGSIAGSLAIGRALRRHDAARLLLGLYAARALAVAAMLALPVTAATMLAFGAAMGFTLMVTLAPTAQLVSARFGVARLGSLFGVVMLVHQVGGFAGVWLGGALAERTGVDRPTWMVDIALAALALALLWPLRRTQAAPTPRRAALPAPS